MAAEPNALAAFLNRSLDDELIALVQKHGADAVRDAAKRATAKKRGRRPEKDWLNLKEWVYQDAEDWLYGRDALTIRSNYAVAKAFAEKFPGHNVFATKERIERKLRQSRRWYMLVVARERSESEFPHEVHLRTLRELAELDTHPVWARLFESALGVLIRYREKFGAPEPDKPFEQLESELRPPVRGLGMGVQNALAHRGGLFGTRAVRNSTDNSNP
jgi:hypothetical protein